jgi:predicted O-methyltransferase YrrM
MNSIKQSLKKIHLLMTKNQEKFEKRYLDLFIGVSTGKIVNNIPTHMKPNELNILYKIAGSLNKDAKVLEIGSYLGASSCYIAAGLLKNQGHLICVDTWRNETMPEGERDTMNQFLKNIQPFSELISPIQKNSQHLLKSDLGFSLDFVFIDGDHSYQGCNLDYHKVSEWLLPGGILAFHDCRYFEGVSRTIGEALASGKWQFCGWTENLIWLRKIDGINYSFTHKEPHSLNNI